MVDRNIRFSYGLRTGLLWLVLFGSVLGAWCQNNPYKINDRLYPVYVKAYSSRMKKIGLALADTLYRQAVSLNDKKAQCLALTIPFLYAFHNEKDINRLNPPLKRMQDKALQTGYVQYYYYGSSNKVIFLINQDKFSEALEYIESQLKFAQMHKHPYGIYIGYRMLGLVHQRRTEFLQAIESYQQAAEYCLKYLPDQDVTTNYRAISECYGQIDDAEKMLEYAERGLKIVRSEQVKTNLLVCKAYAEFLLGNDEKFKEAYRQACGKQKGKKLLPPNTSLIAVSNAFMEYLDGKGIDIIDALPDIVTVADRLRAKIVLYKRQKNFRKAMECQSRLYLFRSNISRQNFNSDLASINVRYNNQQLLSEKQRMEYENTKLELSNTQLTLQNSSLELGRIKTAEHLARLNSDRNLLFFNNQKLISKQLRDSLDTQRIKRMAKDKELSMHSSIMMFMHVAVAVILLITAIYAYYSFRIRRKLKNTNTHLRKMNSQLKVASDRALQSDRMKTMFVQNMSHEIRTPLNAIVGFSQLLVSMGGDLTDEEKAEMAKDISENSELLLTLINDILDITALESGKYVMTMEPCNVNELCSQAVNTVMHRKAPDVQLVMSSTVPDDFIVTTDVQRVKQVLINMLTNSEKNTRSGSIILGVSHDKQADMLVFSVTDTGIGVPKDKMKEIFERFKKLDSYKQGSGLGLNICRMIAERLGGSINIDPDYEGGARFVFEIPVK